MWASIIAVLGTLAGGTLSFTFQARLASQAHAKEISERSRAELLDAASALGSAMLAYRHSQLARQHHLLRTQQRSEALSEEVRTARGEAWSALFRTQLLTADEAVLTHAKSAMTSIRSLKTASQPTELDRIGEEARQAIETFVESTRNRLLTTRQARAATTRSSRPEH